MDDTAVQNAVSPKPEKQKSTPPWQQIGASFEFDGLFDKGGEFMKQGAEEFFSSTVELVKDVAGFPSKGSMEFQNPNPEMVEQAKKREEADHERMIFQSLEEARRNAQKFAHELSLDDLDAEAEAESMPGEVWNKKLHLSLDFDKKHTLKKPYYMTEFRKSQKGETEAIDQIGIQQKEAEVGRPTKPDFDKNKANELGPTSIYNAAG